LAQARGDHHRQGPLLLPVVPDLWQAYRRRLGHHLPGPWGIHMAMHESVSPCLSDRCGTCDLTCKLVKPTGPTPAQILCIGEKPGKNEAKYGHVFVGDAGRELDKVYLAMAGLERKDVRVTNCVKCRLGHSDLKPTPKQIDACARHWLPGEVEATEPELIILMGATACSLVPSIELAKEHGIIRWVSRADHSGYFGDWEGLCLPMFHPAAGLHLGSVMIHLLDDFRRLRKFVRGTWRPHDFSDKVLDYSAIETAKELDSSMEQAEYQYLPVDTESDGDAPWSLQYSPKPGMARLIRADRPDLIARFDSWLYAFDGMLLHYANHDLNVLEQMGVHETPVRDTMQESYQFSNLPQGLKALAYRLLGVRMRDYNDVVEPPSRQAMMEWLAGEYVDSFDHKIIVEIQLKTKVKFLQKPSPRERDLKRLLRHGVKPEYPIWQKAAECGLCGFPISSIAHASVEESIVYACMDADMTGQIATFLEEERRRIVTEEFWIEPEDVDA